MYADRSEGRRVFLLSAILSGIVLMFLALYNWKTICCCCMRSRKGSSTTIRRTSGKDDYAAVSTDSTMFSLESDLDDIISKGVVDEMSSHEGRGGFSHFVQEFGLDKNENKEGYRTVLSYDDDEEAFFFVLDSRRKVTSS